MTSKPFALPERNDNFARDCCFLFVLDKFRLLLLFLRKAYFIFFNDTAAILLTFQKYILKNCLDKKIVVCYTLGENVLKVSILTILYGSEWT